MKQGNILKFPDQMKPETSPLRASISHIQIQLFDMRSLMSSSRLYCLTFLFFCTVRDPEIVVTALTYSSSPVLSCCNQKVT